MTEKPSKRAEAARRTHSRYPRWTDVYGDDHAFADHPNYNITRHTFAKLKAAFGDDGVVGLFCPEWLEHHQFAIGVAEVIGMKPSPYHHLETIRPGQPFAPDTVMWVRPPATTRKARLAVRLRAAAGDERAQVEASGSPDVPSDSAIDSREWEAARQRTKRELWRTYLFDYDCHCIRTVECDSCVALVRTGDLPPL